MSKHIQPLNKNTPQKLKDQINLKLESLLENCFLKSWYQFCKPPMKLRTSKLYSQLQHLCKAHVPSRSKPTCLLWLDFGTHSLLESASVVIVQGLQVLTLCTDHMINYTSKFEFQLTEFCWLLCNNVFIGKLMLVSLFQWYVMEDDARWGYHIQRLAKGWMLTLLYGAKNCATVRRNWWSSKHSGSSW